MERGERHLLRVGQTLDLHFKFVPPGHLFTLEYSGMPHPEVFVLLVREYDTLSQRMQEHPLYFPKNRDSVQLFNLNYRIVNFKVLNVTPDSITLETLATLADLGDLEKEVKTRVASR